MKVWNKEIHSCLQCDYISQQSNGFYKCKLLNKHFNQFEPFLENCVFLKLVNINNIQNLGFERSSEQNNIQFYNSKCVLFFWDNKITIVQNGKDLVNNFSIDNIEELKFILNKYDLLEK